MRFRRGVEPVEDVPGVEPLELAAEPQRDVPHLAEPFLDAFQPGDPEAGSECSRNAESAPNSNSAKPRKAAIDSPWYVEEPRRSFWRATDEITSTAAPWSASFRTCPITASSFARSSLSPADTRCM